MLADSHAPEGVTARLIRACVAHRLLVLLLAGLVAAGGVYAAKHLTVDALPDLSDVQVVVRAEFPGQAPGIVQDQVTYPLTTAMLAVPEAEVVRGFSMFGTSFVYVLFADGTDLYWARSRVLEQLSTVGGRLPEGVTPTLGPDATAVGWVYQYVLTTGPYCAEHPDGLWRTADGAWHAEKPAGVEAEHVRVFPEGTEACPLGGTPLTEPDVSLAELRSLQDWYLRYELNAVEGVSEVAAIGGAVKQYQVTVDPNRLLAYGLPLSAVRSAIQRSNADVGGRVIERGETEFMVRGRGYLGTGPPDDGAGFLGRERTQRVLEDLRSVALRVGDDGSPVYLRDVAEVTLGPEIRRGVAEWNGEGETAGAVVVMRFGENAQATIDRVRERLFELEEGLPPGVAVEIAYDRSDLIERAVATVSETLVEEVLVVGCVILVFLLHARSALVAAAVLPAGVLLTLGVMYALGLNANIMSLGGIAISIGVMVDSSIVMVENAHKHLERERADRAAGKPPKSHAQVIANASAEVGPTLFFSLLIIMVSFLPILVLDGQSGRLFKPLAYTKTFAMAAAAFVAVTLIPVVMVYALREGGPRKRVAAACAAAAFLLFALIPLGPLEGSRWPIAGGAALAVLLLLPRQRIHSEDANPVSRVIRAAYEPAFRFTMKHRFLTLGVAPLLMLSTLYPWSRLGSEFMPPLEEGDLLYMPVTDPGISVAKATEVLARTDALIAAFPEVESVFGKIGRAETATDPAPVSMLETTITLHRDEALWRKRPVERFYTGWPGWLAWAPSKLLPPTRTITPDELIYGYELTDEQLGVDRGGRGYHVPGLNDALQIPGLTNAWTMPIRTRIDMLSTGIRTPVGVKILGPDLEVLARLSAEVADLLKTDKRTRSTLASAFPDKAVGGSYLDLDVDRAAIARYGLSVADVQEVVAAAIGGENVTSTVEGLERYPVNLRYPRELRDDPESLEKVLVATPSGAQVPLGLLADVVTRRGPPMIKSEDARPTSWVYVDIKGTDIGTFVENAQAVVAERLELPPGYTLRWSGQYESMQAARERLRLAIPLAAVAILLLLFVATRSWLRVAIVLLAVPFSLIGAAWFTWFLGYEVSLAVWVGVIALAGLDAETGLVMLLYLDDSHDRFRREGRLNTPADLMRAVHDGAVQRIRPKTMTVMTTLIGLFPLLFATGAGADTMQRLAAPMIGGLLTSFLAELLLYPILFYTAKRRGLPAAEARG